MRDNLSALGRWLLSRAKERTTWVGLGIIAVSLGHSRLAEYLRMLGDAAPLILGTALTFTSTSAS